MAVTLGFCLIKQNNHPWMIMKTNFRDPIVKTSS